MKQMYFKRVALSILLGVGGLFMILAVLSEYSEFPAGDTEGLKLLLIGVLLFVILTVMAFILPRKYLCRQ
jgi:polyferredoxin